MPKNRFHPKLEQALRELAGLPWSTTSLATGVSLVRCEGACPIAAVVEAETGKPCDIITAACSPRIPRLLGWTPQDRDALRFAADRPDHPMRPRLLELLGMEETK